MKRILFSVHLVVAAAMLAGISHSHAEDGVDSAKTAAFDNRIFAGPLAEKTYACFVRRYDASHLAQHLKQKVSAMKLLVTAENAREEKTTSYSFRLGIKYHHRTGNFDSSSFCGHVVTEDARNEIRFGCGVDCEGGGINVALSKDDKPTIIRLERIRIWNRDKPDQEAEDALIAGADDKIFRVDRADAEECAELVTDRRELTAIRHK
ncbi:hypothetical protein [Bradyrhizobium sp. Leo170]|uniref:hypothetical protein n=1 Tax=Bradyrhizobium sp. Leo170 TaxID=1571199 RepID=UPI00102E6CE6|nr:hypothetical protein [Bradyrhizobium sp. Leo170]TAI62412.1 hypothetical protein CWO89_29835 [Bradyrhizobium sp. Leo170]